MCMCMVRIVSDYVISVKTAIPDIIGGLAFQFYRMLEDQLLTKNNFLQ